MFEIYEHVDPVRLTAAIRVLPEDPDFQLNRFLPDVVNDQIRFTIDELTHLVRTASFRAYDAPVKIGRRDSMVRRTGEMPALGTGYPLGEYARLLQQQLRGADASEIVGGTNADARRGIEEIRARMELARGQALSTGAVTLTDEDGLTLEADFSVPGGQLDVAPAEPWTDPDANIIADLTGWADLMESNGGPRPQEFLAGRGVTAHILANNRLRSQFGTVFGTPDQLGPTDVNRVLERLDLPTIALGANGRPIRPARVEHNGTVTDTYPADKITLLPGGGSLGQTRWGPTVEALELAAENRMALADTPGVIALVLKSANPASITTVVNAVGLPLIEKPKAMLVATPLVETS